MADDAGFDIISRAKRSRLDGSTPSSARRRKRGQSHSAVEGRVLRELCQVDVDMDVEGGLAHEFMRGHSMIL